MKVGQPDDIRLSFNEAVEIYDKVRPSYPAELFDALFQIRHPSRKSWRSVREPAKLRRISLSEGHRCMP